MSALSLSRGLDRLTELRRTRAFHTLLTFLLVLMGPVLAVATFLAINVFDQGPISTWLRVIVLADLVYVMIVATLVLQRIGKVVAARRARSAGSRLHLRLTGVFALIALVPTVLVAVFATLTVNFGLEGWFSDRVRQVVGNSLSAAQAYEQEHRDGLREDAKLLADFLGENKRRTVLLTDGDLRALLSSGQTQIQRGLREAFIIDSDGNLRARGERSYLFDYDQPTRDQIDRALAGETVIIEDWPHNEFRALVRIDGFADRLVYVTRDVDGGILNLLDDTQATVRLYQQLENDRGKLLFEFALIYLAFAIILVLAAIWLGLWFAERLSGPVGQLAGAAQRVGAGDLDVRVAEGSSDDDEIAMLGRMFNQMTRELKGQRDALLDANSRSERRRRLFDSVLSGVTTGVIGLNADGNIDFMNPAAVRMLALDETRDHGSNLGDAMPEFAPLFEALRASGEAVRRGELKVTRGGALETLLVRLAVRRNETGRVEGYVLTFDDVTDLVSAQRMAAWGDVARRIAHEIKNPLTPIQLSAERLKRKFLPIAGDQADALEQYTDVIVRQTTDLRRIVDEFSRFARMPEPDRRAHDITAVLDDAVALQRHSGATATIDYTAPDGDLVMMFDATMISQALTNVIKNALEATEIYAESTKNENYEPRVRVTFAQGEKTISITVEDNGTGLPADRARLFEPYVTTRDEGTGLGLPIVKKIIEEHGGGFELDDAPMFEGCTHKGARATITLPLILPAAGEGDETGQKAAE